MSLSTPAAVQLRLEGIERELAVLQNEMEDTALPWFRLKRDREVAELEAYAVSSGTTVERKLAADAAGAAVGAEEEARWEVKRALVRILETRANIGMAILKSQGRS